MIIITQKFTDLHKHSNFSWWTAVFHLHLDSLGPQIIIYCGKFTIDLNQLGFFTIPCLDSVKLSNSPALW